MSIVTGIMLLASLNDDDAIAEVQAWLAERRNHRLIDTSDAAGGGKHPQFEALAAGINFFGEDEDAFAAFVVSRDWNHPENVVLTLQPEEGASRVFRPSAY